jgi:Ca2+/H+ antiporter
MGAPSPVRSFVWGALALIAVVSPFLWLVGWSHGHPLTSWIAAWALVLMGVFALRSANVAWRAGSVHRSGHQR